MNTRTDLANAALSYLGEMRISDIDDANSVPARACKQFMQDTIDEVLRSHRWSCAIRLAILTASADAPIWGYQYAYPLPNDSLQLLEINGQEPSYSQQYFEIQGRELLSNWTEAKIRYVKRITISECDPLLAKAIALSLASKICIPLSLNQSNQQSCVAQYSQAIQEAKRINAIEKTGNSNQAWGKLMGNSPLVRSRNYGSSTIYRYGYYQIPGPL